MKTRLFTALSILIISAALPLTVAALTVPAGDVSGTWATADSPVLVEGEITVQPGLTLSIEAGVEVVFQGNYKFNVLGQLQAVGAEGDSILFTAAEPATGWAGVRFIDTDTSGQPGSEIAYCRLEYGRVMGSCPDNSGGAVMCSHSSGVVIRNNLIVANEAVYGVGDWGGGGIYCEYCSPEILNNEIGWNVSAGDGGGIYCIWSNPRIEGNNIHHNSAGRGGGIVCFQYSAAEIWSNVIADNGTHGIYLSGSSAHVANNVISGNSGSGIECYLVSPRITGNLFTDNWNSLGGAIHNRGSSPLLNNNTFVANDATQGGAIFNELVQVGPYATYSMPMLNNCILWGNTAGSGSQVNSGYGCSTTFNYCCVQDMSSDGVVGTATWSMGCGEDDPLFVGLGEHPYSLDEESTCRNAGTPDPTGLWLLDLDLAGNERVLEDRIEVGAYEYFPGTGVAISPPAQVILAQNYPNPFNPVTSITFDLPQPRAVDLQVYDLSGRLVRILARGEIFEMGRSQVVWNGEDDSGRPATSGIYLYRLEAGDHVETKRMTLLK